MDIPSKYNPQDIENQWYDYWMKHGYFYSTPDDREPYTIVIPPPNVTGVLHMGHMLNNTLQDVLTRKARLQGKNACWVPGTDHASIATEAKVVAKLKSQGISKEDITREEFMEHAWDWTHQYGGVILEQLKKLGCSCDWKRTKFTMDDTMSASVIQVFVSLYNKGLIYKGSRMVNWDPEAQTTLSDEEVVYQETQGQLYYIKYSVTGSDDHVVIATTRPETILGDTAVCIHPEDQRFKHLMGKKVIVPVCDREIPIIQDDYVDMEFGTGCLKVTPAHDENDHKLGERHGLEFIDIFHPDGTLNANGLHFEGRDRFEVREAIVSELEQLGKLVKKEAYVHKVGTSERTKAVIEPRISEQWFLKMEALAKIGLDAVDKTGEVVFYPEKFRNMYRHWMANIRDWNISRQLWWGQRIPAYYFGTQGDMVVAEDLDQALSLARERDPSLQVSDLHQDEDVLDTWFSSWLWPMSVFDGIRNPENEEINYYYPTNDLVTAPDIIFFWVARMIMAGYEFRGEAPFKNVYFTGVVRDSKGRKMSKSLGNSPDALGLIKSYGADAVRVGLLLSAPAGNDLLFNEDSCQQGKNFANKIWNAFRLVQQWEVAEIPQPDAAVIGLQWYQSRFNQTLEEIEDHFQKFRLSDALMSVYKLIWDDFCSWLLEIVKPAYHSPVDAATRAQVLTFFEKNLKVLHPFMPFISEAIWQYIAKRKPAEALIVSPWPASGSVDQEILDEFAFAAEVISGVRAVRKEMNLPLKEALTLSFLNEEGTTNRMDPVIAKLAKVKSIGAVEQEVSGAVSFRVKRNSYFIPVDGHVDVEEELSKIREELQYTKGFLQSVQKKLNNERFVSNAPENVVALEKKKAADAVAKIATLEKNLANLES